MSEFKTNKISPRKGTTQTIGDSGDTLSIASGVTVTNAGTITTAGISGGTINNTSGTISGLQQVINWDTTPKTTGFTATVQTGYFCNTTSAAFTVTLPASPTAGDMIAIKDYANTFDTNNLTLNANGNKIQGSTTNFDINVEGANSQFIYVDATRGWVLTDASKASDIAEYKTYIIATGGTETTCGDYKIHTFTSPGTFCVSSLGNPAGGPNNVDYLVVAGGGGGSGGQPTYYAGGGGAGGWRASSGTVSGCYSAGPAPLVGCVAALPVSASAYPITVGAGGSGGPGPASGRGTAGSSSTFSTITSAGGGSAGGYNAGPAGQSGGSGGGGGAEPGTAPGGAGNTPPVSPPQGNPGGTVNSNAGGGGGGAVSAGTGGSAKPAPGGTGAVSLISASPVTYSTGGAGGYPSTVNGPSNSGNGGSGIGGNYSPGGAGGSGIVIIRYKYQ